MSLDPVYKDTQWGLFTPPGHIDGVKAGYRFPESFSQKPNEQA